MRGSVVKRKKPVETNEETWMERPQWIRIRQSPDFKDICAKLAPGLSVPKDDVLFASEFPAFAYQTLVKILDEMTHGSHYFSRMMKARNQLDRLKLCCEAIALLSISSGKYSSFFLSFDCMSPLFRVLDVDSGDATLYILSAMAHILENCVEIAETILTGEMISKLMASFEGAKEMKHKKAFLFCLSSVVVHKMENETVTKLYQLFRNCVEDNHFFVIAMRGLSRLSNNWPGWIIENNLTVMFVRTLSLENEFVVGDCVNVLSNVMKCHPQALTQCVTPDEILQRICWLTEKEPSDYTIALLDFLKMLCEYDPMCGERVASSPLASTLTKLLLNASIKVKMAAMSLVLVISESSREILTPEMCSLLIDGLDTVPEAMAVRLITVLVSLFQTARPGDDVFHEFMDIVQSLDTSRSEELAVVVANATSNLM